jgi:hypothetical protein
MEKIYCWSAKMIDTKFWQVMTISFSPKDLETLKANVNEKGWVNLNASERKEVGKYWETHSVTINNWKPEKSETPKKKEITIDDIPF